MAFAEIPSAAYLHQRLSYQSETGKLFWKYDPSMRPQWNSCWAGKEAFTTDLKGYRQGSIDGRNYLAHRIVWVMLYGEAPPDQIDHINHDRSDNRKENLREVTNAVNGKNQSINSRNTSGVMGVSWSTRDKRWYAYINVDGARINLGSFKTRKSAIAARLSAEQKFGFHKNHGL